MKISKTMIKHKIEGKKYYVEVENDGDEWVWIRNINKGFSPMLHDSVIPNSKKDVEELIELLESAKEFLK